MGSKTLFDKLTDKYERLTPYERAALTVKEATGRRRRAVIEAVSECKSPWEAYWTEHWRHAIFTTSTYAVHAALGKLACSLAQEGEGRSGSLAVMECTAWLDALRQLEGETGTPFGDAAKLLPGLDLLATFPKDEGVPHAQEYRSLRHIWDAFCDNPNRSDAHRALPPLPDPTPEELAQETECRRLAEAMRKDEVSPEPTGGSSPAGDIEILWIPDNGRIMPGGPGGELAVDFSRLSESQVRKVRSFFEAEARGEAEQAHGYDWTPEKASHEDRF